MYHQFFSFWQEMEQRFIETFTATAKETELTLYSNAVPTTLAVWCSVTRRVAELVPETSLQPPAPRFCQIYYLLTILACPSCERGACGGSCMNDNPNRPTSFYLQTLRR